MMRYEPLRKSHDSRSHWLNRVSKLVLAVLLLSNTHCLAAQTDKVISNAPPQDALIVLQMGACERRCPVYNLVMFADGSTVYDGRYYVTKSGLVRGKLSLEVFNQLLAAADSMKVHALKKLYAPAGSAADNSVSGECLTPKSDAPTAILTVSSKGRSSTIVHFRGCSGAEAMRLTQLEDRIMLAANIAKLTR